jgi:hypothetical protein
MVDGQAIAESPMPERATEKQLLEDPLDFTEVEQELQVQLTSPQPLALLWFRLSLYPGAGRRS